MSIEYIRYELKAHTPEEFVAAYATAADSLRAAPECLAFELTRCEEAPQSFVLRIEWRSTEAHLSGFRKGAHFPPFLSAIRPFVGEIAEMRHYAPALSWRRTESSEEIPTLHAWMGGDARLAALFDEFYRRVHDDAVLGPVFGNMEPQHAAKVAAFVAEVFGGPARYTEQGGSHAAMIAKHLGRMLTSEQRTRWVALLLEVADQSGVPDDPEFRAALVGYLEWGSRLAMANSAAGVPQPPADLPMPKWNWGPSGGPWRS